jgi:EAL domain-containing protein (putative c-di-GMP-specific phosphodiesterase class I)/AmiR/NasT family two-component response regulator
MAPIRVLIAEDERVIRDALARMVDDEESLELVAVAADAEEAVTMAGRERPDVALIDVKMPGGGGVRATKEIRRLSPETRVVALSAYDDRGTVLQMVRAGVSGYLVKGGPPEEIVETIHRSVRGYGALSGEVAAEVIAELGGHLEREEHEHEERRVALERMERAITGDGIHMVFQPIFDLQQHRPVGFEALARFTLEPRRTPDVWFDEAAALGVGPDLELTALRLAMAEIGSIPDGAYLAVNISPATAMSRQFQEGVTDIDPGRVVLEITEHAKVEDYEALAECLRAVRARGARLAIDDAGAGFASLRHTLLLAPDVIKLDISLTQNIHSDRARRALATALISFASEIEAAIVAEGIETQEQMDTLRSLGVEYGQGYFLARPGPLVPVAEADHEIGASVYD